MVSTTENLTIYRKVFSRK